MFPEVLELVIGRRCDFMKGVLRGYRRATLKDRVYPGIIRSNNDFVTGLSVNSISALETRILDLFEDDIYDKIKVNVDLDGNKAEACFTYAVNEKHKNLILSHDWDSNKFQRLYLDTYLKNCKDFRNG